MPAAAEEDRRKTGRGCREVGGGGGQDQVAGAWPGDEPDTFTVLMELQLVLLVLVSLCGGQDWIPPPFCHGKCPPFRVVEMHQDFEERLYAPAKWLTTQMGGATIRDLLAAKSRLEKVATDDNTWPVLINSTSGIDLSYSYFVPPDSTLSESTDASVTLQSRPEVTVYVRSYDGTPSIERGQNNRQTLYDALIKAGKIGGDANTYTWAGYDSYWSFTHHNEVWIEKTQ
ncbi:heme-binding protein 2-like [Spinachia spinachia]